MNLNLNRITPAPAGKTLIDCTACQCVQDHPRTCGENSFVSDSLTLHSGSPPHLRGKLWGCPAFARCPGITPAPAGKTNKSKSQTTNGKDHPRTCGENHSERFEWSCVSGSPPHLRGKLRSTPTNAGNSRITPAPAGKTLKSLIVISPFEDHPRTCGENWLLPLLYWRFRGSPPHLRGKRENDRFISRRCGITPAPAGKTLKNDVDTL